ncbi:MAG TPA: response regulator [Acidovorax sp.]|nr:response regulator [Acidovorax sp.]
MNTAQTLLYAEDDPNDVTLMTIALQRTGAPCNLHVVKNGVEAIEWLRELLQAEAQLPCVILLDVNLPMVTGLEVLSWIRAEPRLVSVPVWVFTSSKQPVDTRRSQELGATEYHVKPSTISEYVAFAKALTRNCA